MFFLHCFSILLSWQGHHETLTCQEVLGTWLLAIRNHYYYTWHSVPGSRKRIISSGLSGGKARPSKRKIFRSANPVYNLQRLPNLLRIMTMVLHRDLWASPPSMDWCWLLGLTLPWSPHISCNSLLDTLPTLQAPSNRRALGPFETLRTLHLTFKQPNFSSSFKSQLKQPFGKSSLTPPTTFGGPCFILWRSKRIKDCYSSFPMIESLEPSTVSALYIYILGNR